MSDTRLAVLADQRQAPQGAANGGGGGAGFFGASEPPATASRAVHGGLVPLSLESPLSMPVALVGTTLAASTAAAAAAATAAAAVTALPSGPMQYLQTPAPAPASVSTALSPDAVQMDQGFEYGYGGLHTQQHGRRRSGSTGGSGSGSAAATHDLALGSGMPERARSGDAGLGPMSGPGGGHGGTGGPHGGMNSGINSAPLSLGAVFLQSHQRQLGPHHPSPAAAAVEHGLDRPARDAGAGDVSNHSNSNGGRVNSTTGLPLQSIAVTASMSLDSSPVPRSLSALGSDRGTLGVNGVAGASAQESLSPEGPLGLTHGAPLPGPAAHEFARTEDGTGHASELSGPYGMPRILRSLSEDYSAYGDAAAAAAAAAAAGQAQSGNELHSGIAHGHGGDARSGIIAGLKRSRADMEVQSLLTAALSNTLDSIRERSSAAAAAAGGHASVGSNGSFSVATGSMFATQSKASSAAALFPHGPMLTPAASSRTTSMRTAFSGASSVPLPSAATSAVTSVGSSAHDGTLPSDGRTVGFSHALSPAGPDAGASVESAAVLSPSIVASLSTNSAALSEVAPGYTSVSSNTGEEHTQQGTTASATQPSARMHPQYITMNVHNASELAMGVLGGDAGTGSGLVDSHAAGMPSRSFEGSDPASIASMNMDGSFSDAFVTLGGSFGSLPVYNSHSGDADVTAALAAAAASGDGGAATLAAEESLREVFRQQREQQQGAGPLPSPPPMRLPLPPPPSMPFLPPPPIPGAFSNVPSSLASMPPLGGISINMPVLPRSLGMPNAQLPPVPPFPAARRFSAAQGGSGQVKDTRRKPRGGKNTSTSVPTMGSMPWPSFRPPQPGLFMEGPPPQFPMLHSFSSLPGNAPTGMPSYFPLPSSLPQGPLGMPMLMPPMPPLLPPLSGMPNLPNMPAQPLEHAGAYAGAQGFLQNGTTAGVGGGWVSSNLAMSDGGQPSLLGGPGAIDPSVFASFGTAPFVPMPAAPDQSPVGVAPTAYALDPGQAPAPAVSNEMPQAMGQSEISEFAANTSMMDTFVEVPPPASDNPGIVPFDTVQPTTEFTMQAMADESSVTGVQQEQCVAPQERALSNLFVSAEVPTSTGTEAQSYNAVLSESAFAGAPMTSSSSSVPDTSEIPSSAAQSWANASATMAETTNITSDSVANNMVGVSVMSAGPSTIAMHSSTLAEGGEAPFSVAGSSLSTLSAAASIMSSVSIAEVEEKEASPSDPPSAYPPVHSRLKGVFRTKHNKWLVQGKLYKLTLGGNLYDTAQDAEEAWDIKVLKILGWTEYAETRLNFPDRIRACLGPPAEESRELTDARLAMYADTRKSAGVFLPEDAVVALMEAKYPKVKPWGKTAKLLHGAGIALCWPLASKDKKAFGAHPHGDGDVFPREDTGVTEPVSDPNPRPTNMAMLTPQEVQARKEMLKEWERLPGETNAERVARVKKFAAVQAKIYHHVYSRKPPILVESEKAETMSLELPRLFKARAQVHNAELSSGLYFTALEAARGWDRTVYSHCGWTRHAMGIMNFPMEQERSCGAPDPNAKCKCLTMNANKKVKDKHASHNAGLQQRHMDGAMSAQGIVGALPDGALSHPSMAFDRRGMDMRSFDLNAGFPIMNMSAPAPQFHSAFGAASMNMSSYYMPMTYPMASRTESSAAGLVPTSIDLPAGSDASLGTVNMEAMATMPEPLPSLYSGMHVQSY